MAWGNHKEELCRLGNEHTNQQTRGLNQVAAQAIGNRPQPLLASPHGQHGPQHGQRLTGQTCMENMDDVLVSFHGGGKFKQGTSHHDLPFYSVSPNHPVLAPHQVGGSLP